LGRKSDRVASKALQIAFQKPHREGTLSKFPNSDLADPRAPRYGVGDAEVKLLQVIFVGADAGTRALPEELKSSSPVRSGKSDRVASKALQIASLAKNYKVRVG
jgi:hypothetical protein